MKFVNYIVVMVFMTFAFCASGCTNKATGGDAGDTGMHSRIERETCTVAEICDKTTPPTQTVRQYVGENSDGTPRYAEETLTLVPKGNTWEADFGEEDVKFPGDGVVTIEYSDAGNCTRLQTLTGGDAPTSLHLPSGQITNLLLELVVDPVCGGGDNGSGASCATDLDCGGDSHGTCLAGTCDCQPGYTGSDCGDCANGFHVDGNSCVPDDPDDICKDVDCGNGECVPMGSNAVSCRCDTGYTGNLCDRCDISAGYEDDGNGNCVEVGDLCDNVDCNGADHGVCIPATGTCDCQPGYTGGDCGDCATGFHDEGDACVPDSGDPCDGVTCNDNGECVPMGTASTCECDTGYAGNTCNRCDTGYEDDGNGVCVKVIVTDPCDGIDCGGNAGTCVDLSGSPHCVCNTEYVNDGPLSCIEKEDSPCDGETCSGHGSCMVANGNAVCDCHTGYGGDDCSTCANGFEPDGNGNCRIPGSEPTRICVRPLENNVIRKDCTFFTTNASGALVEVVSDPLYGNDFCLTGALYSANVTPGPHLVQAICDSGSLKGQTTVDADEGKLRTKSLQLIPVQSGDPGELCVRPTTSNGFVAINQDLILQDKVGRFDLNGVCQYFSETGGAGVLEMEALRVAFPASMAQGLLATAGAPGSVISGPNGGTVHQHLVIQPGPSFTSNLLTGEERPVELNLTAGNGDQISFWVTALNGQVQ